ncbi:lipid-A-disaccharide synthase [Campylobacter jejuni]|nr:lipid-A-disaccharide synthase [Campylobacter jejuni]ECP8552174.1 lipid-A-disaccharide synthase [Campylobacter jejuni]ECP8671415.1 lipid-A-disaccharide synthase [Campylobacter jejuni]ECP8882204.1 lipid-A-disaccharide synthase [Campylobacter jejuni]ECP9441755.1 lipid-A-disaccharide synthase [Campylobacter jejuni]
MKTFLVCALEPSANLHLKEVLKAYKNIKYKEIDLVGIYDESLCKEFDLNSKPLYSSHEFSAMGFIEVLPLIFKSKKDIILTCKYKGKV